MKSPTEVFRAYIDALEEERWNDAASLFTHGVVKAMADQTLGFTARHAPFDIEAYLEQTPGAPREMAEYLAEQSRAHATTVEDDIAGTTSLEEAAGLAPRELLARRLEAMDARYKQRRHLEKLIEKYPDQESTLRRVTETHPRTRYRVLGEVIDDDRAFVLHEVERDTSELGYDLTPGCLVMRRVDDRWQISEMPDRGFAWGYAPVRVIEEDGTESVFTL